MKNLKDSLYALCLKNIHCISRPISFTRDLSHTSIYFSPSHGNRWYQVTPPHQWLFSYDSMPRRVLFPTCMASSCRLAAVVWNANSAFEPFISSRGPEALGSRRCHVYPREELAEAVFLRKAKSIRFILGCCAMSCVCVCVCVYSVFITHSSRAVSSQRSVCKPERCRRSSCTACLLESRSRICTSSSLLRNVLSAPETCCQLHTHTHTQHVIIPE